MHLDAEPPVAASAPRVAVVLVNWNGAEHCLDCLDALLACDYPNLRVFLVDNASGDGSVERVRRWCEAPTRPADAVDLPHVLRLSARPLRPVPHVVVDAPTSNTWRDGADDPPLTIVRAGSNLGFAGGNNLGMRVAGLDRYDYFWLLNTDTVIDRRALDELVACAQADPSLGMVGSTLRYHASPGTVQALGGARFNARHGVFSHIGHGLPAEAAEHEAEQARREMAYVVGASMLVPARFVRAVGPMQEDYFLYYEEVDWAWRGMPAFRPGYAPRSVVYHKVGMSSAKSVSWFSVRLLYRNRIRCIARFAPEHLGATKRHLAGEMLRRLAKGQLRRAGLIAATLWDAGHLADEARAKPWPSF